MRKIIQIAKVELSILCFSPVAWVVMIIFMIQCGVSIMDLLQEKEASQQLDNTLKSLTADVFSGQKGFFVAVMKYLYLYIPLLTMGIVSRELSSGSIKLLQASPVTNLQVILGKYLGLLTMALYFIIVLMGISFTGSLLIDNFDWGIIVAALVGIFLLIAAYAAIGLFMSSLTSYQVVAAISTVAVFAGLNFIGEIGKGNAFVREITYWLSLSGRTDHFMNGMISSQNVSYFLLVIVLFLGITIMRLNDGRIIRSELQKTIRYIGFVSAIVLLGYITSMPRLWNFWDLSRFEANTLTTNSKAVIADLKEPITIKSYVNILHPHGRLGTPRWRKFDLKQFDQYTRYIPNMRMEYTYFYDHVPIYADSTINIKEKAEKAAIAHAVDMTEILSPEEIKKIVDLAPEHNAFVRYIHHGQDSVVLRMFMDATGYPLEAEITSALKRLITPGPIAGFLVGHDERSIYRIGDKDYNKLTTDKQGRTSLINKGFDMIELTTGQLDSLGSKLTVLVIADPFSTFTENEVQAIHRYLEQGGNMLLAAEPGKTGLLNPLLASIPAKFSEQQVYQRTKDVDPDVLSVKPTKKALSLGLFAQASEIISMPTTVHIEISDDMSAYDQFSILQSATKNVWTSKPFVDTASVTKELDKPFVLGHILTRQVGEKQQKIALLADADFMSNNELSRHNLRTVNANFTSNLFRWFTGGEFPVDTTRQPSIDNSILVDAAVLKKIKYTWVGLFPFLIGLAGTTLLISRKRK